MDHVHFIGIGGSGLSAIARLLIESGYSVSGSDRMLSPITAELTRMGARITAGHSAKNVQGADLVIRSSAIPDDNPEVVAARVAGIQVAKRSDVLSRWMQGRTCIAVAGTHGKTTTTAMTAWALVSLGLDPSYIIGGVSANLGSNAHAGKGQHFVIEADEYDRMFLGLHPDVIIITHVEHDHPDCYPTEADYLAAFREFVHSLKPGGTLIVCADHPLASGLVEHVQTGREAVRYGLHSPADYRVMNISGNPSCCLDCDVYAGEKPIAQLSLQIPGEHNLSNALAVIAAADVLGLPSEQVSRALSLFTGTGRRFEVRGEAFGVTVIDDYAHHPTEIRATLAAARMRYPSRRLWAVWQPHTYSRTLTLLDEFSQAFGDADQVIVTEVYAAREHNTQFSAVQVVQKMQHPAAHFIPGLQETGDFLLQNLVSGDVLLVFSAGDADQVSAKVLDNLRTASDRSQPLK